MKTERQVRKAARLLDEAFDLLIEAQWIEHNELERALNCIGMTKAAVDELLTTQQPVPDGAGPDLRPDLWLSHLTAEVNELHYAIQNRLPKVEPETTKRFARYATQVGRVGSLLDEAQQADAKVNP